VCNKVQIVGVLGVNGRGFSSRVGGGFDLPLGESQCVYCGQCAAACPTGALTAKDDTGRVWDALADPNKRVRIAPAPSVRAQLGECFGMPLGTNVEGKLVTALRRLGFDDVFDIDTFADLTIVEEANEFLERFTNGGVLPMTTSCSPAWVRFLEVYYPDLLPNMSTCKSPQGMYGATMKTYYAKKLGLKPEDLYVVSVMPCLAKKYELTRPGYDAAGVPDVDASVSTVGLAQMIKRAGIDFATLSDEKFDPVFGIASGAGHIFGASGGVMEAALRTAAEKVTGKPLVKLEFTQLRGMEGIKEAEIDLGTVKLKVCAASGLSNAAKIMDKVRAGTAEWSFIEIMSCPGGCVNGGGQPHLSLDTRNFSDYRQRRADALYSEDERMVLRKSHENPDVLALYRDFLGEPGGELAHHVLHTYYEDRSGTYKWIKA
jgi:NADP-reducing hydrogenase subunit HndD